MSVKEKINKARSLIEEMEQMLDLVPSQQKDTARVHLTGLREIFFADTVGCIDIYVKMPKNP